MTSPLIEKEDVIWLSMGPPSNTGKSQTSKGFLRPFDSDHGKVMEDLKIKRDNLK